MRGARGSRCSLPEARRSSRWRSSARRTEGSPPSPSPTCANVQSRTPRRRPSGLLNPPRRNNKSSKRAAPPAVSPPPLPFPPSRRLRQLSPPPPLLPLHSSLHPLLPCIIWAADPPLARLPLCLPVTSHPRPTALPLSHSVAPLARPPSSTTTTTLHSTPLTQPSTTVLTAPLLLLYVPSLPNPARSTMPSFPLDRWPSPVSRPTARVLGGLQLAGDDEETRAGATRLARLAG